MGTPPEVAMVSEVTVLPDFGVSGDVDGRAPPRGAQADVVPATRTKARRDRSSDRDIVLTPCRHRDEVIRRAPPKHNTELGCLLIPRTLTPYFP